MPVALPRSLCSLCAPLKYLIEDFIVVPTGYPLLFSRLRVLHTHIGVHAIRLTSSRRSALLNMRVGV